MLSYHRHVDTIVLLSYHERTLSAMYGDMYEEIIKTLYRYP